MPLGDSFGCTASACVALLQDIFGVSRSTERDPVCSIDLSEDFLCVFTVYRLLLLLYYT